MNQGNHPLGGSIQMAVQQQMQNLMANAYSGAYAAPGQYPLGDPGMMHRGQGHEKLNASADR